MKMSSLSGVLCAAVFSFISMSSHAALVGRLPVTPGGTDYQAAYDTTLDITWVTNAALSGVGNWTTQLAWASNLNYLGYDDWRLASMSVSTPPGTYIPTSNMVSCATATEVACRDNELGYMYYFNLDGTGDNTGDQTAGNVILTDIQTGYWTDTEFNSSLAWVFLFGVGNQGAGLHYGGQYGWAVRDGDVLATPAPAAVWLFGSGLLGLIGMSRWNLK